jgi:hypothetical protein
MPARVYKKVIKPYNLALLSLFCISFITIYIPLFQLKYLPGFDSPYYLWKVNQVINGEVLEVSTAHLPLLINFAAWFAGFANISGLLSIKITMLFISGVLPIVFFFVLSKLYNPKVAFIAAFLLLLTPTRYRIASDLYNNSLALLFLIVVVFVITKLPNKTKLTRKEIFWVVLGVLVTAGIFLTHVLTALFLIFILGSYFLYNLFFEKKYIKSLLLVIVLFFGFILSYPYSFDLFFGLPKGPYDVGLYFRVPIEAITGYFLGTSNSLSFGWPGAGIDKFDLVGLVVAVYGRLLIALGIAGLLLVIKDPKTYIVWFIWFIPTFFVIFFYFRQISIFPDRILIQTYFPLVVFAAYLLQYTFSKLGVLLKKHGGAVLMSGIIFFSLTTLTAAWLPKVADRVRFTMGYSLNKRDVEFVSSLPEFIPENSTLVSDTLYQYWIQVFSPNSAKSFYEYHYVKALSQDKDFSIDRGDRGRLLEVSRLFSNSTEMSQEDFIQSLNSLKERNGTKNLYILLSKEDAKWVATNRIEEDEKNFVLIEEGENLKLYQLVGS